MDFRLIGVDAPETQGVGSAFGGAKCERERELGFAVKEKIVELTTRPGIEVRIRKLGGYRTRDREAVHLSVDGTDLTQLGIEAGLYKAWPFRGRRALTPKPEWCAD